jgi:predicted PurR-regulated permease PerM
MHVSHDRLHGWLTDGAAALARRLATPASVVVSGAVGALANFVLMVFILFFVIRGEPAVASQARRMLPVEEERRARLWRHVAEVTRAVFLGIVWLRSHTAC